MEKKQDKQKILIEIEYDGTNFCGWQSQDGCRCVQSVLEEALSKFFCCDVQVFGSGRTDAGVHALGQTAHFDAPIKNNFKVEKLPYAINQKLPQDVSIVSAKVVKDDFDARKSVKKKTYLYKTYVSNFSSPLDCNRKMRVFLEPNIQLMKEASAILLGEHDFAGFMSTGSSIKSTIRTIYSIKIKKHAKNIDFEVTGNGFLYNMVRIVVGTLLEVGQNKKTLGDVVDALENKNRKSAGRTAPACGLYLKKVYY